MRTEAKSITQVVLRMAKKGKKKPTQKNNNINKATATEYCCSEHSKQKMHA